MLNRPGNSKVQLCLRTFDVVCLHPKFGRGAVAPPWQQTREKTRVTGSQKAFLGNVLVLLLPSSLSRIGVCFRYSGYAGVFIPLADEFWDLPFLVFRSGCDSHSCLPSHPALLLFSNRIN